MTCHRWPRCWRCWLAWLLRPSLKTQLRITRRRRLFAPRWRPRRRTLPRGTWSGRRRFRELIFCYHHRASFEWASGGEIFGNFFSANLHFISFFPAQMWTTADIFRLGRFLPLILLDPGSWAAAAAASTAAGAGQRSVLSWAWVWRGWWDWVRTVSENFWGGFLVDRQLHKKLASLPRLGSGKTRG